MPNTTPTQTAPQGFGGNAAVKAAAAGLSAGGPVRRKGAHRCSLHDTPFWSHRSIHDVKGTGLCCTMSLSSPKSVGDAAVTAHDPLALRLANLSGSHRPSAAVTIFRLHVHTTCMLMYVDCMSMYCCLVQQLQHVCAPWQIVVLHF